MAVSQAQLGADFAQKQIIVRKGVQELVKLLMHLNSQ
ncbi:hypothetical protein O9993_14505 [Vibrio lentus]|nr:hypothetical protein [Vibrio lentus]